MKSAAIIIICLLGLTACESNPTNGGDFGSPHAFKGDLNNLGGDTAMPQGAPARN